MVETDAPAPVVEEAPAPPVVVETPVIDETDLEASRERMIYGLGVLALFHAAAMTRSAETRERLRVVAFFAVILAIGLTLYGLFLPMTMSQKL